MVDVNLDVPGVSEDAAWADQEVARLEGEVAATQAVDVVVQPALSEEEDRKRKEDQNRRAKKSRDKKAAKKQIEGLKYNSRVEVTKADALELLSHRIQNDHVRGVCYESALNCASETGVFPNRFFFAHGYLKTLESQAAKAEKFLTVDSTAILESEVIHQDDLYAIFDYSVSWREPDVTFDQFIEQRRKLKSSWFELGQFIGM